MSTSTRRDPDRSEHSENSVRPAPTVEECWLPNRLLAVRRVQGRGTPAVMVHGLGGNSLNWTDLAYGFHDRLDSWAVDLPGFGASPPPRDGDYSVMGHARAVVELIDEQIQEPVHLFGNSLGGAVALQVAARYPDRIRSLTMISPALPGSRPAKGNIHMPVMAVPGVGERLIARYMKTTAASRTRATINLCFASPSRLSGERLEEAIVETDRRDRLTYASDAFLQSLRGLLRTMLEGGSQRPWRLAEQVMCPTLLIYGRRDELIDAKAAHQAGNRIPDARVVLLPDCGHVAQMEHPEEVIRYWNELIDGQHPRDAKPDGVRS